MVWDIFKYSLNIIFSNISFYERFFRSNRVYFFFLLHFLTCSQFDYETLNNAMLKTTMGDTIVLPKGLTKVDNAKQPEIPALMDLCLSRLHTMSKTNVRYEKYLKSRLPKCLRTRLLNNGPSVACDVCKKYLFGNVVIRLFVPSHMLCNGDCAYHYIAVFTCHVCCTASFPGGSEFPNDLIELNWTTIETSK